MNSPLLLQLNIPVMQKLDTWLLYSNNYEAKKDKAGFSETHDSIKLLHNWCFEHEQILWRRTRHVAVH